MESKQTEHIKRNTICHSLQQRSAGAIHVIAQAFIQNESRENKRTSACQKSDRGKTQIGKYYETEKLKVFQSPFIAKYNQRQMKKSEGHYKFGREQRPHASVEGLADYACTREKRKSDHRPRGAFRNPQLSARGQFSRNHSEH